MISNRPLDSVASDYLSPYARMIPGKAAMPLSRLAAVHNTLPTTAVDTIPEIRTSRRGRTPIQQLLPHPIEDRFEFFQLIAADLCVLAGACGLLSFISPAWSLPWASVPIFAVLVTLFGFAEGLYGDSGEPLFGEIGPKLARSILFAMALVCTAAWGEVRPLAAVATSTGSLMGLLLCRLLRNRVGTRRRRETESRKVLIVGGGPVARAIASTLRNDPLHGATVCGFVDDLLPLSPAVLGRLADLDWLARAEFIDEVILVLPGQPVATRQAAEVAYRNHLDIRAVLELPPGPWFDSGVDRIGDVPVVTLHREPLPGAALFLKRLLDVTGAALGLLFASPLMAIVGLLIRWDSPGPVVYSAERTGAKGRHFRCYKFRSMVTNAEHLKEKLRDRNQRQGPIFKIDDDPRVTRIGRFIRRYSLDELPQLWNVLRGEMSLVGPRPHPIDEVKNYELQHYRRLDVKPGITGLWQITARDCPSFDLNMHLDLTYIEHWSLGLDLRILSSTVRVLFVPEGV